MTDMGLALDCHDGRGCGGRPRSARLPTDGAAFLLWAQVADCVDDGEGGTGPATVPRPAGLWATLPRADWGRGTSLVEGRRLFALRPVPALGEITHRGLLGFDVRLQGGFPLQQGLVLRPPVVRLPWKCTIGLLRQHHRLLGKEGRARVVPGRQRGGGYHVS
jgi:hypothetical protein